MSLLDTIERGKKPAPPRILLYGSEGSGKSTFGAQTPQPIFVSTEDGLGQIDCHRFPLAESFEDVEAALTTLLTESHTYETVVLDSADWAERLAWDRVCRDYGASSIERVDGGFGKGYVYALACFRRLLDALNRLHRQKQMMVLIIAHAKVEKFEDPETSAFDRYSPRLHKHVSALLTEWSDAVLFATQKFRTQTEDAGFGRKRAIAHAIGKDGGERVLRTVGGPSCVAKNRFNLDAELPLDWNALLAGITSSVSGK